MLFTSYEFLGFVAVLFLLYYLVPKKCQWALLLVASYLFYFIAGADYLVYIVATTVTTYFAALKIEKNALRQSAYLKEHKAELSKEDKSLYKSGQKRIRIRWAAGCILINLGILALVKYSNFFISNINQIGKSFGWEGQISFLDLALPLGISFYTFQAVGYLIDVYRGTVPAEKNLFKLALFISFFPLLIQGPISRFGDLAKTLYEKHSFKAKTVAYGLQRILWGYFKKLVIADRILSGVSTIIGEPSVYRGTYVFVGMLFYTLELYADFTGGIDITIGIAQVMGISVQENFNRPYFSKSLKEYWRRWHISMCSWFRDYVFYPVSTCKPMQKFTKFSRRTLGEVIGRRLPMYLSSFVVWFATGIWHGASWNFIVWGLSNWLILMVSEEFEPLYAKFHKRFAFAEKRGYQVFQTGRTFLLVCVLNIFDCYASLSDTFGAICSMFTTANFHILWDGSLLHLGLTPLDYGILAIGVVALLLVSLSQRNGSIRDKIAKYPYPVRFVVWYGLFLIVLLTGAYGIGYDASQFIYNRF
ncbi:MAG: MBOAT family protein [Lachnoclostridium sp.]|nr:MBOAT family protein [Lachnospira sp.]MCM1248194.1 MBOAT family protein [Lachnoclostridium sp.]MCM1534477.1 MBOAT family protein [Clostridium sp.]